MISDSKLVVECVCGHGDDGLHTVVAILGMRIVGCPDCPNGKTYLLTPHYLRALS